MPRNGTAAGAEKFRCDFRRAPCTAGAESARMVNETPKIYGKYGIFRIFRTVAIRTGLGAPPFD
ncbi:MAG: hypothetical protein BGN85_07620 [Alphaproteobacteria bacterium 64-11]|nr:MAG: hypothetical protein BGN85_07620 [Alphaproteobacteria bacterium 64-11]